MLPCRDALFVFIIALMDFLTCQPQNGNEKLNVQEEQYQQQQQQQRTNEPSTRAEMINSTSVKQH